MNLSPFIKAEEPYSWRIDGKKVVLSQKPWQDQPFTKEELGLVCSTIGKRLHLHVGAAEQIIYALRLKKMKEGLALFEQIEDPKTDNTILGLDL